MQRGHASGDPCGHFHLEAAAIAYLVGSHENLRSVPVPIGSRRTMPGVRLVQSVDVVAAPDLLITEYIGRVTSGDTSVSSCLCTVRVGTKESPQTPGFDEYVMVLEGEIRVWHGTGMNECVAVSAGQGFVLDKGTRVQWEWPGPCKYVAICLPAFSPQNAGREEATEPVAKTETALKKLRELHATSSGAARGLMGRHCVHRRQQGDERRCGDGEP